MTLFYNLNAFCLNRDACLIAFNDTDTMILTGGSYGGRPLDDVSVYTEAGWKEELPKLNKARYMHGCSTYLSDGNRVKSITNKFDNNVASSFHLT